MRRTAAQGTHHVKDGLGGLEATQRTLRLRVLATTDLHVHLLPFDYYTDRPQPATGLAQAASLIRSLRAEAGEASCVLLDNGDFLSGSLLSDLAVATQRLLAPRDDRDGGRHPMIAAMNALGFDAGNLGNHEFDHGLPALRAALAKATFPIVSANLLAGREASAPLAPPWTILVRDLAGPDGATHRVRVGVLGLGPPQVAGWTAVALDGGLRTRDIVEAAREEIPRLRAAGADLVVALCHSGIGHDAHEPHMENAAPPLAALPGLDALIVGHTHEVFPGPDWTPREGVDPQRGTLHGKPAVQPGFFGRHVGVMDLRLTRADGRWAVAAHSVRVVPVPPDAPPDPAVVAAAEPAHRRLLALTRRPIGSTQVPLHSYFSVLGPDTALDVVADAKRREAQRLLRDRPESALPILCTVSPFKSGGRAGPGNYIDIPPGPLAFRQAADLYIYANCFCLAEITGAGLRAWLERSAGLFRTLRPGETDQPLVDPDFPAYNFDTIDGLTWTVDPTSPPRTDPMGRLVRPDASRIRDLRHEGRPVADDDRFVLATSSYRLGLGGGFAAAARTRMVLRTPTPVRDVVLAHVSAAPVHPAPRARWRFLPLAGTSAWFDSGPGARDHLAGLEDRKVEPLGPAPGGFHRFRLRL